MDLSSNFQELFSVASLISLLTLSILEIVLGIDNIIFISIVAGKLPRAKQPKARAIGLMLALIMRVALLFSISWIANMKEPLFSVKGFDVSGRDLILLAGGIFLLYKTTVEIHNKIEGHEEDEFSVKKVTMNSVIFQIVLIDIVFSFDSILTAVGLVSNVLIMILAVIIAMIIMILFSGKVSDFINRNPAISALFCLCDFNQKNGATQVLPFSHKIDHFPSSDYIENNLHSLEAPAGSVIMFDSMLLHRAGNNTSRNVRIGVNHVFTIPIIKQQINLPELLQGQYREDEFLNSLLGYKYSTPSSVEEFRNSRLAKFGAK